MDSNKHEMNEKRLIRWLLIATLALLVLVLGLQAWRLLFPSAPFRDDGGSPLQDGLAAPQAVGAAPDGSSGKTAMIEDIRTLNDMLSADALAGLSVEELEQLWETGAPGMPIGISAAVYAAEEYAGTLELDSITWKADPELDEAPAHYEVELRHVTLGDFEYKVDAYTGEVLEGRANLLSAAPAAGDPESAVNYSSQAPASQAPAAQAPDVPGARQPSASGSPVALIGEAAAKAAAFTHAGVKEADASQVKCKLDWEDGVQVYEIEFRSGGVEYDYEITAATGAVLKAEWERDDSRENASALQPAAADTQMVLIGETAAKAAAFAHAGIKEADASRIKCELDWGDGVQVYEVEFDAGSVEYEYEIDAVSGKILKAEQDH